MVEQSMIELWKIKGVDGSLRSSQNTKGCTAHPNKSLEFLFFLSSFENYSLLTHFMAVYCPLLKK